MRTVNRSYDVVTLNDGTEGNYHLVQDIFRQLRSLKAENPKAFEAFHGLASLSKPMCAEDQKTVWDRAGAAILEWDHDSRVRVTHNAKDVLSLCLRGRNSPMETTLRNVFSYFAGEEQPVGFKLVSPFKYPEWMDSSRVKSFDIKPIRAMIVKPAGVDIPSVHVVRPARPYNGNGFALRITG